MSRQEHCFQMKHFDIHFQLGNNEQFGETEDRFVFSAPCEVNMYLDTDDMLDFINGLLRWEEMLSDRDRDGTLVLTYSKRLGRDHGPIKYLTAFKIGEKIKIKIIEFDYISQTKMPQQCLKMVIDPVDDVYQLCSWFLKKKKDSKEAILEIKQKFE